MSILTEEVIGRKLVQANGTSVKFDQVVLTTKSMKQIWCNPASLPAKVDTVTFKVIAAGQPVKRKDGSSKTYEMDIYEPQTFGDTPGLAAIAFFERTGKVPTFTS